MSILSKLNRRPYKVFTPRTATKVNDWMVRASRDDGGGWAILKGYHQPEEPYYLQPGIRLWGPAHPTMYSKTYTIRPRYSNAPVFQLEDGVRYGPRKAWGGAELAGFQIDPQTEGLTAINVVGGNGSEVRNISSAMGRYPLEYGIRVVDGRDHDGQYSTFDRVRLTRVRNAVVWGKNAPDCIVSRGMFYGDDTEHDQEQSDEHPQPEAASDGGSHSVSGHAPAAHSTSSNPLSVVGVSKVSEISRDGLNQTGFLALERFDGSARSVAFLERVFSTFTESDNIIIDLRNCGGGDAEMVKVLSSYFFDEPTHLLNTSMPDEGNNDRTVVERWTTPNKLSQYFAEKPLKILISPKTFSAAESFSFGMQAVARAELVGETTGGGGYINDFFPLPYDLGVSISVGRTYDPRTGKDWQGIGVIPEVQVEQDHALIAALTIFTEQSGKLDKLKGEELQIYQQVQKYTNAWYGADHETMKDLLSNEFIGLYSDQSGSVVERISFEQLIANTRNGKGRRDNEIYYNRIIRDIDINGGQASVKLILRETIHQMLLTKIDDEWLIIHDDFNDKRRDPA